MNDPSDRPHHVPRIVHDDEHGFRVESFFIVWPGHERRCPVCALNMQPRYVRCDDPETLIGWLCLNRRCTYFAPVRKARKPIYKRDRNAPSPFCDRPADDPGDAPRPEAAD
jgi:hypothetical protein